MTMLSILRWPGLVAASLLALPAAQALAQGGGAASGASAPSVAREVVQPVPPQATQDLNQALRKLSASPRDPQALLAAGNASLKLDDANAAIGFFTRLDALEPESGRGKAGLAAAQVRKGNALAALDLFVQAERKGASLDDHAGDCGLAWDLVGDNARAQGFYRRALAQGPDAEITRRLALSLAISGDQYASETTLLPLLKEQDIAGYRTRAFALAVLGKTEDAVSVANAVMPPELASRISPYLRYMPRLTKAQQAAAANFGHFPQANEIGKDDPRITAYVAQAANQPIISREADARLVPAGEPLGQARPAQPVPPPVISVAPKVAPAPKPAPRPSVAEAFADLAPPPETAAPPPKVAAVDITKITPAREAAAKPPEEKKAKPKPAHPSRIWVQVATGRDRKALASDWKKLSAKAKAAFKGRSAYIARWGQTNRLLTGPFDSAAKAQAFVRELKKAGIDSFAFTSDAGEVVDPVGR